MPDKEMPHFKSQNLTSLNISKIADLFPGAVVEGKINFNILRAMLGDNIYTDELYEFSWVGKYASIAEAGRSINKTLRPCVYESKDWYTTGNLYIEGDNLDVLKLLQESYQNKIKAIYIDPPYNTGNNFIYNDNFKQYKNKYETKTGCGKDNTNLYNNQKNTGYFHSNWCSMIFPRLLLAKNLLCDDGVIFISIDENEAANMQKMCSEVFGEDNYAATFLWTKTSTPPALSFKCRKTVEYVFAYEKKKNNVKYYSSKLDNGDAPLLNTGNSVKTLVFPAGSIKFNFLSEGIIEAGKKEKLILNNDIEVRKGCNINSISMTGSFKWGQAMLNKEISKGTFFIIKSPKFSIRFQRIENENSYKTPVNFINVELNNSVGVSTNESSVKELNELGLSGIFDYAKPVSLIQYLISMTCKFDQNALILDFFSGSSTTAEAVMRLNSYDGGNRKFIMVQIPEQCNVNSAAAKAGYENICEIGKERIRRAGEKIKLNTKKEFQNLDIGFRVLKLDDIT